MTKVENTQLYNLDFVVLFATVGPDYLNVAFIFEQGVPCPRICFQYAVKH